MKFFMILLVLLSINSEAKNKLSWWENFFVIETLMLGASYAAVDDSIGREKVASAMGVWSLYSIGIRDNTTNEAEKFMTSMSTLSMGLYNLNNFDASSSDSKVFWNNMMAWQVFGLINYTTYEFFGKKSSVKYVPRSDGGMLYFTALF